MNASERDNEIRRAHDARLAREQAETESLLREQAAARKRLEAGAREAEEIARGLPELFSELGAALGRIGALTDQITGRVLVGNALARAEHAHPGTCHLLHQAARWIPPRGHVIKVVHDVDLGTIGHSYERIGAAL